ncbi:RNA polymerase sigma factor [Mucisphaera calidilacus]|uniref:ECF RNA polymerase sigma-E factor n=1 Tax=Mucisphaera calidilacus TaxID=2527982 RepID=A0A518BWA4_9BACT|nr:sigma-70 family RNA polymerase sigma factor [Mucisphaera calidilacus]QDU71262.1 ECF RNA polymerase sigma-E factor [Mucisphaera calidilacus]
MAKLSDADRQLLEGVRAKDPAAWQQLVDRYHGRLIAFARRHGPRSTDAEDVVQEALISFLTSLDGYRGDASLETYLFTILRRRLIDARRSRRVPLCEASIRSDEDGSPIERAPGPEETASWYARRDENQQQLREALVSGLDNLVRKYRDALNFRDLMIVEAVFYAQLKNREVAELIEGASASHVAVIKHRAIDAIRQSVTEALGDSRAAESIDDAGDLLTEVWEASRPSCPKRNTLGANLLGTLEPEWSAYITFHVDVLGCSACRANRDDLQQATADPAASVIRNRILESTVGFLSRP